ncbi:hypothetical protein [Luteipulveratus mongoliensis]|uniref:Uncharacterized protein n=1 Tax=Luteipulveratus mongoliensis TaxID=571913 RepID=A0A0K1JER0_9MICO|nr:hypothetical protein [Luteipulveratus mongoliensis]AKU15191.1 hypothetical protein VV02_03810 [Luteipulveratus mongoliensis]
MWTVLTVLAVRLALVVGVIAVLGLIAYAVLSRLRRSDRWQATGRDVEAAARKAATSYADRSSTPAWQAAAVRYGTQRLGGDASSAPTAEPTLNGDPH